MKRILLLICTSMSVMVAFGQSDTSTVHKADTVKLEDLSLEALMNVPIVSASRKKEDAFDAPVTSYVITRAEIEKSGVTSIPEALRLCPGLFVTEVSNGNYQVEIRGMNNVPPFDYYVTNTNTLVMIDNRPIFSNLQGGTNWEQLPVGLADIDRIEVVAGPAAALFGPNAKTGVINILTRRATKEGLSAYSNTHIGLDRRNTVSNMSVHYKFNDKFAAGVSGNYTQKERNFIEYFAPATNQSVDNINQFYSPSYNPAIANKGFANENKSLSQYGINGYAEYKLNSRANIDVSFGTQEATALKQISIFGPRLSNWPGKSSYVRARAELYGFTLQGSYNDGNIGFFKGIDSYQYDYKTTDLYADYTWKFKDLLELKPAVSYQNAVNSDLPYKDKSPYGGIFNNSASMYNVAGSFRVDVTPIKMIRIIAAVRGDQFKNPQGKTYLSYQFAVNIKPSENHHIRLIASRAYNSQFIFPSYVDFNFASTSFPGPNIAGTPFNGKYDLNFKGNQNLEPGYLDLFEAGYRLKVSNNFSADLSLFYQIGKNYYTLTYMKPDTNISFQTASISLTQNFQPNTLPMEVTQMGSTLSFNWVLLNGMIQLKPFATFQQTQWKNFSPYYFQPGSEGIIYGFNQVVPGVFPDALPGANINKTTNITAPVTPSVYGGLFLDFNPTKKLSINLSGYYFDSFKVLTTDQSPVPSRSNDLYRENSATKVPAKFLLNARVSYQLESRLKVFVNGRNLLNTTSREFYASDRIGLNVYGGFVLDF